MQPEFGLNNIYSVIEIIHIEKYSLSCKTGSASARVCVYICVSVRPGHAKTCLMPYANNKGADQPAHRRSLISTFVVRCFDSMICIIAISKVSRFQLASVAEQAGLNLTWSKIPKDRFSRDVAQFMPLYSLL